MKLSLHMYFTLDWRHEAFIGLLIVTDFFPSYLFENVPMHIVHHVPDLIIFSKGYARLEARKGRMLQKYLPIYILVRRRWGRFSKLVMIILILENFMYNTWHLHPLYFSTNQILRSYRWKFFNHLAHPLCEGYLLLSRIGISFIFPLANKYLSSLF